jgi:hypothetical protein
MFAELMVATLAAELNLGVVYAGPVIAVNNYSSKAAGDELRASFAAPGITPRQHRRAF